MEFGEKAMNDFKVKYEDIDLSISGPGKCLSHYIDIYHSGGKLSSYNRGRIDHALQAIRILEHKEMSENERYRLLHRYEYDKYYFDRIYRKRD